MARKNKYQPKIHPVTDNMPLDPQVARLYGKLNIGLKEKEPEYGFLVLDGNSGITDLNAVDEEIQILDGNS